MGCVEPPWESTPWPNVRVRILQELNFGEVLSQSSTLLTSFSGFKRNIKNWWFQTFSGTFFQTVSKNNMFQTLVFPKMFQTKQKDEDFFPNRRKPHLQDLKVRHRCWTHQHPPKTRTGPTKGHLKEADLIVILVHTLDQA